MPKLNYSRWGAHPRSCWVFNAHKQRMGHQVQDVKKKAREKYWTSFLQSMDHRTPLAEVSRKIKIVQGKKAPSPLHPDPTKKSNELMQEWADASSYYCLPLQVRSALATNARNRIGKIEAALLDPNVSDNMPITEEELVGSLEKASSSAPGMDGVTYDGIRFLTTIDGNPVL
ncbi:hypothetical protein GWK47_005898 [Chionoecetes opilio]|uniref:Uncharacterized protein n=1 Tax=Chionoecetes opilio TaxID=41210 RepID=A0A8J4YJK4_CHIOP|nr:hypothetical protein GWK47_005898 [Chionoecetes opilio]